MANPEHLKILEQGVETWNLWRLGNPELRPDFTEADLTGRYLAEADLCRANLSRSNLKLANLKQSDLHSTNLGGASLRHANFTDARLSNASLQGADLRRANFLGADLTGADLRSANLGGVMLVGASVRGANLTKARVWQAVFADLDLSEVEGLDTVKHDGPSLVGIETLYKSRGKISDKFLRDAGVPEDVMQHLLPRIRGGTIDKFYSCFISYSHEDKAFARMLHDRLQGQGIRCWLDEHQLLPGDDLHEGIDRGIRLWDKVLLCASQASLTTWWVDGEINRAFQKEAQMTKERAKKVLALIPLNLDGFLFSADYQSGKKAEITSRVAANFEGWEKERVLFDRELEKVIRALKIDEGGREKPPPPKL